MLLELGARLVAQVLAMAEASGEKITVEELVGRAKTYVAENRAAQAAAEKGDRQVFGDEPTKP